MTSYLIRRLLLIIPTVFFAISFLFLLFFTLPGDPVDPASPAAPTGSPTRDDPRAGRGALRVRRPALRRSSPTTGSARSSGTSASPT